MSRAAQTEVFQVLYRGSSDPDGVHSRGAGWHAREIQTGLLQLQNELSEGDLLRTRSHPGGEVRVFFVRTRFRLVSLPRCATVAETASGGSSEGTTLDMRRWASNQDADWASAWSTCPPVLRVSFAAECSLSRRLLLAAFWEVIAALLHGTQRGAGITGRALRFVRNGVLGLAAPPSIFRVFTSLTEAAERDGTAMGVYTIRTTRALVRAMNPPGGEPRPPGFMDLSVSADARAIERLLIQTLRALTQASLQAYAERWRSLDFLVLQKLSLSSFCLALGESEGIERG